MDSLPELIETYRAGSKLLRDTVAGMNATALHARPIADKWTTLEVVCHLVDSELVLIDRMKRILAEPRPLLIAYDENEFVKKLGYQDRNAEEELAFFEHLRRHMASILSRQPASCLERSGVHAERGLVTAEQMLNIAINHVTHHVKFIAEKRKALGLA